MWAVCAVELCRSGVGVVGWWGRWVARSAHWLTDAPVYRPLCTAVPQGAVMSDKKRRLVAYHESGHALVSGAVLQC